MRSFLRARGQFSSHRSEELTKLGGDLQEACYIPTWPWFDRDMEEEIDMTPRCVTAVSPYDSFFQFPGTGRHVSQDI